MHYDLDIIYYLPIHVFVVLWTGLKLLDQSAHRPIQNGFSELFRDKVVACKLSEDAVEFAYIVFIEYLGGDLAIFTCLNS